MPRFDPLTIVGSVLIVLLVLYLITLLRGG